MPENKKVLLVTRPIAPPWDEASKNFAYNLAKDLGSQESLELHLMTRGILPELPKSVVQENIYTSSQNDFTFSQKIRSLFFQWKNRHNFDIVHYFFTPTKLNTFFIRNFLRSSKTRSVQTIATLREDIFSDEEIKELMIADLLITYSDYSRNKLNSLGFNNVKRVYPGIDLENYKKRLDTGELRRKFGFSTDDFIINFSGEYTRLGAMDDVVETFIEISKKIPAARLSMAVRVKNEKDTRKKTEVVEKLRQNGVLEKIVFHDDGKYNMADIFNLCDISLFPVQNMFGKFDVPLAAVEPMACEKPVIVSDIPILKEFARPENSVTIERGNVQQLTGAILDLYNDPEKREILGKAGRKFCEENFDISKISEIYRQTYQEL